MTQLATRTSKSRMHGAQGAKHRKPFGESDIPHFKQLIFGQIKKEVRSRVWPEVTALIDGQKVFTREIFEAGVKRPEKCQEVRRYYDFIKVA